MLFRVIFLDKIWFSFVLKRLDVSGKYSSWHEIEEFRNGKEKVISTSSVWIVKKKLLSCKPLIGKQCFFPCIFLVVTECLCLMAETSGSLRNQVILLLGRKSSCRIGVGFHATLTPRWQPLRV